MTQIQFTFNVIGLCKEEKYENMLLESLLVICFDISGFATMKSTFWQWEKIPGL